MFALTDSGKEITTFQDKMHIIVTAVVVLLSKNKQKNACITQETTYQEVGFMKKTMIVLALCSSLLLLNACGNTNKDTEPETAATEVTTVSEDTTEAATEEETAEEATAEEATAEAETAEAEAGAEGADDAENAEEATDAENEEDGAEVAETASEEEAAA